MNKYKYLKFSNKGAIENNPILTMMYIIAYPLAILAKKTHITPNSVTLFSFVFAILSVLALAYGEVFVFISLWLIAYILDFVDGTLARMTGQIETSALDFDHLSDVLKIVLIFLGFGLYFNDYIVWILSFLSSASYIFYTLINHELSWVHKCSPMQKCPSQKNKILEYNTKSDSDASSLRRFLKSYFQNKQTQKKLLLMLITTLTVIHAHTLLIFFFIPLDLYWAYSLMMYFILIICYQMLVRIMQLKKMKRVDFLDKD